jgi:enoyl-CoA hydratase/carnithine racemase
MGAIAMTKEPVWLLQIDRTDRRNAIDSETARNLAFMLREAESSAYCRAVVLYGIGPHFCAGSDLKELAGKSAEEMAVIESVKAELAQTIQEVSVPVIAAVEGFALGGGVSIAASCDIVVSSCLAKWLMPEVANGWLPPWGIQPVVKRCGASRAKKVLYGIEPLIGEEANQAGLVDYITEEGQALVVAKQIANSMAALPPSAVRAVKSYLNGTHGNSVSENDQLASRYFVANCRTPQALQTLAKFGAKK